MLIDPGADHLLFDGDCGICTWFAEWCQRTDSSRRWRIAPYQDVAEDELAKHDVTWAQCAHSMHVIARSGRVHRGAFAVNAFLWQRAPWRPLIVVVYAIPVFLLLEIIGYRIVANHRARLSKWLGLEACRARR